MAGALEGGSDLTATARKKLGKLSARAGEKTVKTRIGEDLDRMLSAFHSITEKRETRISQTSPSRTISKPLRLKAVWQVHAEGCLEKLILDFERGFLIVTADENDDSIDLIFQEAAIPRHERGVDASGLQPWDRFIGKPFGWGWVTVNQQGYCDGLLIAFEGIVPQIMLNVTASSIKIAAITATA